MGVKLLPEWVEQDAILVAWPRPQSDWQPWLKQVEQTYLDMALAICRFQQLIILCYDNILHQHVSELLARYDIPTGRVTLLIRHYNDTWTRDYAPLSASCDEAPCLLNFVFNGWGGKYPAELDNAVTPFLYEHRISSRTGLINFELELEGGALETDGLGTLLTTRHCLLESNRNPGVSEQELTTMLKSSLGVERVIYLQHGQLIGDDTDGHIDTLARFCREDVISHVSCEQHTDPHYESLGLMREELLAIQQANGEPYQLIELPLPDAILNEDGERLPATYANFLIINGAVLFPTYQQADRDSECRQRLAEVFPEREIIPINALPLIQQFGSIHCASMQLASGTIT